MPWVAAAGAVVGSLISSDAAGDAADTQADAANKASELQWQQYQQSREDQAPWREEGEGALGQIGTGIASGGDFNRDFTLADFKKDPGYEFRLRQGLDSVQGSRAARGSMLSGSTLKALSDYGSDYASGEYGKAYDRFNNDRTQRFNRLATVAGIGQTATNNVGTLGATTAGQIGSNMIGAGNAQAAGQIGQANAINGTIGNLQSLYQLQQMNKTSNTALGGNANGYYNGGVGGVSAGGSPDGYW